jgi:hypothetical protein
MSQLRGGGYEPIQPEPIQPEPEQPPIFEEYNVDQSQTWDQVYTQANSQNMKRFVEEWGELSHNKASQQAGLQDQINQLFLKQVLDAQSLTNALAQNNAVTTARINSNGVALDTLTLAGKVSAGDVTSAKLADSFQGAVKSAIEAAVAAVPGTNAPASGTSGVAQGGLQTAGAAAESAMVTQLAVANNAIMAQITKLAEAVSVLTLKVAALEVNPTPSA